MTKQKTTKRALLSSMLVMLICVAMLIGTTFAWFTDSVTSGNNVITAGNLDIEVQYTLGDKDDTGELKWENLDGATNLFQKGLWEPGHTEVVALRIKNNGSLALKYVANMNIVGETVGKTKNGADIKLSDILTVSTLTIEDAGVDPYFGIDIAATTLEKAFESENAIGWGTPVAFNAGNVLESNQSLYVGKTQYVFVKVDMAETVGNEANHDGKHIPTIDFGINVLATQYTYENDSFDNQYDKDADYPGEISNATALVTALKNGGTYKVIKDIALDSTAKIPNGVTVNLDLNGKTITGPSNGYAFRNNGGNLTITGNGTVQGDFGALSTFGGKVVIENGTYISNGVAGTTHHCIYVGSGGNLVINGGTFNHNGAGTSDSGAVVTIYDYAGTGASLQINGGTFIGSGTYISAVDKYDTNSTLTITGGTFSENVTSMVPDSYTVTNNGDGTWTVSATKVESAEELVDALENNKSVAFQSDIKIDPANLSNAYGTTGINVKNGQTIDGNGHTLDIAGAGGTWDSGINTTGGIIKNITVTGSFRGIFINHNSAHSEPVVLDNVTIDGTTYTISCDQGSNQTLIATNSTFNGWTSYAATLGSATFENCSFGEGNGYAYMRPYSATTLTNCVFENGFELDATRTTVTLVNCYVGETLITADNVATLLGSGAANAVIK